MKADVLYSLRGFFLNTPQAGALVTGSQTAVVATLTSAVVFLSVPYTFALEEDMRRSRWQRKRPHNLLAPEGRDRALLHNFFG